MKRRTRVRRGWLRRPLAATVIAIVVTAAVTAHPPLGDGGVYEARAASPAMIGFSFSPRTAAYFGEDPAPALLSLMNQLAPDLVRLPVYWDSVEAKRGTFDFTETDDLIKVVDAYNQASGVRPARVVLIVGMRNMGYPELYVPSWVPANEREPASRMASDPEYTRYLRASFKHYHRNPTVSAWQIENEPLDKVPTVAGSDVSISGDVLQDELELLRSIDSRPAVITSYTSATLSLDMLGLSPSTPSRPPGAPLPAGHPLEALQTGDILGLDLYVVTGDTSLSDASATKRIGWKRASFPFWFGQTSAAGKPLWITEMQGAPWPGLDNFTTSDLLFSANAYRHRGASVILMWGVEQWLLSPQWMQAGKQARLALTG